MSRLSKLLVLWILLTAWAGPQAWALVPLPPTVPPGVSPHWLPAPGSPEVEYAPNLQVDLFRYQGRYYYWVAGGWRVGETPRGPWRRLREIPPALLHINPALFKSIYKPQAPNP